MRKEIFTMSLAVMLVGVVCMAQKSSHYGGKISSILGRKPPEMVNLYDKEAAELLSSIIASPGVAEYRYSLARHYSEKRYGIRIVEFFRYTADYACGKKPNLKERGAISMQEKCGIIYNRYSDIWYEKSLIVDALQNIDRIIGKDNGITGDGLEASEHALHEHGALCVLQAEWAYAYLLTACGNMNYVDRILQEVAIRRIICIAEETKQFPLSQEGEPRVYFLVGEHFVFAKDYISAYIALLLALDRIDSGCDTGSFERNSFRKHIQEHLDKIGKLAEEQRLNAREDTERKSR